MATYHTLSYNIAAVLGVDPAGLDIERAFIKSQYDGIADTDTNILKTGTWDLDINKETTAGTVDLPATDDAAFNPAGAMYIVEIKYYDRPSQKDKVWRSGPPDQAFTMTADRNLADVVSEPVKVVTEQMRDDIYETAQLLTVQQAATDGQVETSLETRGLPTTGAELSVSTGLIVEDALDGALAGDQVTDGPVLERLTTLGATDRSASQAASRIAYDDNAAWTEEWADLSGWTATAQVAVTGGKLHNNVGATAGAKVACRTIAGLDAGLSRVIGSIEIVGGAAPANATTMIGVTKGTAGDLSDVIFGSNLHALGVKNDGTITAYRSGSQMQPHAYYGIDLVTPLPAGTYYVSLITTTVEIALVLHNADMSIYMRTGVSRSTFGAVTKLAAITYDTRNAAGNVVRPIAARQGIPSAKPRGTVETVARVLHYSVPPTHTRPAVIITPAGFDSRKPSPVVIYCHGSSDDEDDCLPATQPNAVGPVVKALVDAGYVVVSSTFGGPSNWGNPESVSTMIELYKHVRDLFPLGPIGIIGHSMGGLVSLTTIAQRKIPGIVGWYGIEPVCSLRAIYDAGAYAAAIRAAYGIAGDGSDYDAKTAGYDPMLREGWEFRGLPMQFIASPADTVVSRAQNTTPMIAKVTPYAQAVALVNATGPHVDPSHFQPSDVVAFFDSVTKGGN